MFLYSIAVHRWTALSNLSGSATVKGDNSSIAIDLLPEELAELDAFGARVYARHQATLQSMIAKPLETGLLSAPGEPVEADFTEVAPDAVPNPSF